MHWPHSKRLDSAQRTRLRRPLALATNFTMATDLSPVWLSLETSITATIITLVLGTAAAVWRAHRRGIGPALIDGIFLLPLVLPPTVVGFILLVIFGRNGPLGRLLLHFGATLVF